jgi:SAM-dependent methyltransferase
MAEAFKPEWRDANRIHWDERTALHLGPRGYDLTALRAGNGRFNAIEEDELPPLAGKRVLHLQCHFGADTLKLAQRGAAEVVGLDFSGPAIAATRVLAEECGLADRVRFVEADLYRAMEAIPEPGSFDMVFVSWGAICWLPDIKRWAGIVAQMLRPGGTLYLAEGHPVAMVLDDAVAAPDGRPGFFDPYFSGQAVEYCETQDYVAGETQFANPTTYTWLHPLGDIVTGLIEAGMRLDWLHEHDAVTWRMYRCLVEDERGLWRWPDKPWFPLAFSLSATRV